MPTSSDSWQRIRLCWRNTRSAPRRIEHPQHLVHALLVSAVKAAFASTGNGPPVWCWHPTGPGAVEKGCEFELDLMIPGRAAPAAQALCASLSAAPRGPRA